MHGSCHSSKLNANSRCWSGQGHPTHCTCLDLAAHALLKRARDGTKEDEMQSALGAQWSTNRSGNASSGRIRTGWVITGLVAAFMVFDSVGKIAKPAAVVEAFARTGWPLELAPVIAAILLA